MSAPRRLHRAHWVGRNHTSRHPHRFVFFDTEAIPTPDAKGALQQWACGVACYDYRPHPSEPWRPTEWHEADTPDALWEWVGAKTRRRERTVVIAHNLAYDLRIADAFTVLPRHGWELDRVRMDRGSAYARWRRDGASLVMCDSLAVLPVALDTLGNLLGLRKRPLPSPDAPLSRWRDRCRRDVEILRAAYMRYRQWLEDEDLGTWQPTGAGQAWSAWRHRFYTHPVLVHDDDDQREAERAAVWTGRAEAWRHGAVDGGPFAEWDYQAAYLAVAREVALPVRPMGEARRQRLDDLLRLPECRSALVECEVRCQVPAVPSKGAHGILWPVGAFLTTLWLPEVRLAVQTGANVQVRRAWLYHAAPALRAFGAWCWPLATGTDHSVDPVVRIATKHWARALVGRFGVRYPRWEHFGDGLDGRLGLADTGPTRDGERGRLLYLPDRTMALAEMVEGENAVPSIMGYVMAEARVRLWRAMVAAGLENVVHVDTDGLIVADAGDRKLARAKVDGLRRKGRYEACEVFGPRQLVLDGELRASGAPRGSVRVSSRVFEGEVWPMLSTSLARGEVNGVRVSPRRWTARGTDHRRERAADGRTEPVYLMGAPG